MDRRMCKNKEAYERLINSEKFKRNSYVRKIIGAYILVFLAPLMILAYLAEKLLNISGYITCSVAGVLGVLLTVLYAEHKANKEFKRKS